MNKKTVRTCLAAILAASMLGGVASASADGTEDQAAAQKVADMIDAIYVQQRTEDTDNQCAAV